ncbi:hypothetical protein LTR37_008727 [Vermiconidia calcicola]|uniref:Uncharacterized protein n=1 Tax=Vermiconidia calcicola TaxID=1690605 RepID=A0ACC3NAC5_9PEZI|nr:hypothetical protein LTR37_008727 [Vermiconidia calcicola]
MALPVVKTIVECADFSKTVQPYLPQLYTFPNEFAASITDAGALKHLYLTTNPMISALAFSIATMPVFLLVTEINKNYSQVDRVWSILPTLFNAHYAIWARLNGFPAQRVDNVLAFSVVWSLRLTFNYWRKGGYQVGSEDYRWQIIKGKVGGLPFFLLNVLFISSFQILILLGVSTPTYILMLTSRLDPKMTSVDAIFSRSLMALVVVEYFADGQMWNFQEAKKLYQKTAKVPEGWSRTQMDRGFVTSGLWAWSRHPNFAAEQTIWFVLYAWGCYETGAYVNWTAAGAMLYSSVFQGSTPITEWISGGKYPEYSLYKERVGMFLPFGRGWNEKEMEHEGPKLVEEKKRKEGAKQKK